MRRTEDPPSSEGQRELFSRLADLVGLASAAIALAALLAGDASLRRWIALALGALLVLLGGIEYARARCRTKRGSNEGTSREGYGRFTSAVGGFQIFLALSWSTAACFTGVLVTALLIYLAFRGPVRRGGRRNKMIRRGRPGTGIVIALGFVLIAFVGLAGAVIGDDGKDRPRHGKREPPDDSPLAPAPVSPLPEEDPKYADLCEALPDPLVIGHGLGELFRRDGAIKAGCGTMAFRVPETGTWLAAGMCFGELRSVAVASPNRKPAIVYGEAAEFVWDAAQEEELTAVEAAAPEGGDVVLVETRTGTFGFARATRSATPGNEDARQCNEVGGTAEPFARMPPPLVWLWIDLVHKQANWFWPTADLAGETESVAFLSAEGVAHGVCTTSTSCSLEFEEKTRFLDSSTFATLEDLREFMPAEEELAPGA